MFGIGPLPGWDGLHPIVVHFPVALLAIVPVFLLLGLIRPAWRRGLMWSALLLMVLGTAALWLAVPTGEAAEEVAERVPAAASVLEAHESLAETARAFFTILTLIFGVILQGLRTLRRETETGPALALHLPFLALYLAGVLVLMNTAHQGGRLVHEFGVTARPAGAAAIPGESAAPPPAARIRHDDD